MSQNSNASQPNDFHTAGIVTHATYVACYYMQLTSPFGAIGASGFCPPCQMADTHSKYVYRVRWQGYEPEADTWEIEENLLDNSDLMKYKKAKGLPLPHQTFRRIFKWEPRDPHRPERFDLTASEMAEVKKEIGQDPTKFVRTKLDKCFTKRLISDNDSDELDVISSKKKSKKDKKQRVLHDEWEISTLEEQWETPATDQHRIIRQREKKAKVIEIEKIREKMKEINEGLDDSDDDLSRRPDLLFESKPAAQRQSSYIGRKDKEIKSLSKAKEVLRKNVQENPKPTPLLTKRQETSARDSSFKPAAAKSRSPNSNNIIKRSTEDLKKAKSHDKDKKNKHKDMSARPDFLSKIPKEVKNKSSTVLPNIPNQNANKNNNVKNKTEDSQRGKSLDKAKKYKQKDDSGRPKVIGLTRINKTPFARINYPRRRIRSAPPVSNSGVDFDHAMHMIEQERLRETKYNDVTFDQENIVTNVQSLFEGCVRDIPMNHVIITLVQKLKVTSDDPKRVVYNCFDKRKREILRNNGIRFGNAVPEKEVIHG